MAFASTSNAKLAFGSQASGFGTPQTTGLQYMRFNNESLTFAAETATSEEITTSRGVSDVIRTAGGASGDVEFELSYDAVTDLILEGVLQDTAWSTNVITNGSTQQYFTIEKEFTGTDADFFIVEDAAVSGLEVTVETGAIVTAVASFLGSTITNQEATSESGGITAAGSGALVSAVGSNVLIQLGGSPSSAGTITNVQSCSFAIDNGLREQRRIGTSALAGVGSGRFNVTGSLVVYFEDDDEYGLFMSETARNLTLVLNASDGKGYTFDFPKIKYTSAEILASGIDSDIVAAFEWQALEHSTGTCIVTRTP
tara:strand:- start:61 stop:996 length:936 start_codon:yes stop_codon:yes gene_type:complete